MIREYNLTKNQETDLKNENQLANTTSGVFLDLTTSPCSNENSKHNSNLTDTIESASPVMSHPVQLQLSFSSPDSATLINNESLRLSNQDEEVEDEDEDERKKREIQESERLAWALLQQESEEAYRIQIQYLRQNSNSLSTNEILLMESLINPHPTIVDSSYNVERIDESTSSGDNDAEDEEQSSGWDYDRLLELGNILGGNKDS
jgi:hypothetical protein